MVSTWKSQFIIETLSEDFELNFKNRPTTSSINFYKEHLNSLRKTESYADFLLSTVGAVEFVSNNGSRVGEEGENVGLILEALVRSAKPLVLAGEWTQTEASIKLRLEAGLKKCLASKIGKKESLEGLLVMAAKPWEESRIKNLLVGKHDLRQCVYSLVSSEGLDTVLLRAELLLEAGLDKPGYKFLSTLVSSLLTDRVVFETYIGQASPGTLLRLLDMFLALATATHHLSRLYKVLRLLGLEEVNMVHLPRFHKYNKPSQEQSSTDPNSKEQPNRDLKLRVSKGRCERLFTPLVCTKVVKIITQWSVAGASVKDCPPQLQHDIIDRWLASLSSSSLETFLPDVETLVSSANQTTFLYYLATVLWRKYGSKVETLCLKMFIKALTSDINRLEAFKKTKSKRQEIEKLLATSFLTLSEIVSDRTSLAREALLTAFSIVPSQEMLDKIREFAKVSGLDRLNQEDDNVKEELKEEAKESSLNHCRVTAGGKFSRVKPKSEANSSNQQSVESMMSSLSSDMDLNSLMETFAGQLKSDSYGRANTKLRSRTTKKKKFRNLEGLLAIQGELITEASNYNPLDAPCKSLTPRALGLSKQITEDLLIVISAPRWHLLSWVMEWPELERKCVKLLEDPSIRLPQEELKYLNIDYTQFDEWSSDEEITMFTGIEKGYEKWLEVEGENDRFSEHGLTSDDEEVVFNTKHTIDRLDYNDPDHFVSDYKADGVEMMEEESKPLGAAMDVEDEFANDSVEPEPEKHRMEVNFASVAGPSLTIAQLRDRLTLSRVVPGLEGSAVPSHGHRDTQVWMVQISNGVGAAPTVVTSANGGTAVVLRPGPSGSAPPNPTHSVGRPVVGGVSRPGQTTIRLSPVTSPRLATPSQPAAGNAKKVQYLCKQGGQTFLIEGSAVLEKLRAGGGTVQLRLPVSAVRGNNIVSTNTDTKPPIVTSVVTSEGLASRLGSLVPTTNTAGLTNNTNTTLAVRQAAVVSAGLTNNTNTNNKPVTTIVVTNAPVSSVTESPVKLDTAANINNNPTDLIRQLNLARAQGLVVLQQWGEKQVLVHKATGRWIMRQGSRLVTVPPQALGINVSEAGAVTSQPATISSNTMEQLAEFDSILESKFKTQEEALDSNDVMAGNGSVVVVSGGGNTKQIIQLPTMPLKKELVLGSKDGSKSLTNSPVKSPPPSVTANYPKPAEDPETMKRIQAILDDYNDQIRNSPDLHNRPAPRRRTNGSSGNPDSPKPDSPRSSGTASGSTSPNVRRCGSESLSPSPIMSPVKSDTLSVAMAEIKESGAITLAAKPITPSQTNNSSPAILTSNNSPAILSNNQQTVRLVPKLNSGMGQRIVVPASTVQRLVVVSTADGRRMVAVRPVTNTFTNTINTNNLSVNTSVPVTVSLPTSPVSLSTLTSMVSPSLPAPVRPASPDLGIPMEMTPGQIMEAEISATLLDNPESPFHSHGSLINDDHVFSPDPNLDTEFDQVIETSSQSSQLSEFASSGLDLPVSTISVSSSDISSVSILTSESTSNINLNNVRSKRKRTISDLDAEEEESGQSESKVMRLDTS